MAIEKVITELMWGHTHTCTLTEEILLNIEQRVQMIHKSFWDIEKKEKVSTLLYK